MLQYTIFSLLVICGLLATLWQVNLDATANPIAHQFLAQISGTLLVGGVLSLLYKIFVDGVAEKRLRALLRIHDSVVIFGLKEILLDAKVYDFGKFLERSDEVQIVMNDGQRWVGTYSPELAKRFSRKGTTIFYTVDPQGKFVESLAQKTGVTPDELKRKIEATENALKVEYERSTKMGDLEIYHIKNFPTQTLFASEDYVLSTPYRTAKGRTVIPLFVYEDNRDERCYARDVKSDLRHVREESKLAFTSKGALP
jgi:hypothetical protein